MPVFRSRSGGRPPSKWPWLCVVLLAAGALRPALAAGVLETALEPEVRAALKTSKTVGVDVVDLSTGASVYSHEASLPRIIASNTKLLTTAAALDALAP